MILGLWAETRIKPLDETYVDTGRTSKLLTESPPARLIGGQGFVAVR